jgi:histidinol-phosphate phosphatase family protein
MQVVILAGGLGTRLRSVDPRLPKALMPVAGRPFIDHQFELLRRNGITDVLLCIGHLADQIEAHVKDGSAFGLRVTYAFEDPARLLGTGGALVNALPMLADEFFILYGDSYLPTDYRAIERAFRASGLPGLMTAYRNLGKWDPSNMRVAGDRVAFYSKKALPGETDCIDYGLTALKRSVIESYAREPLPLDLARVMGDLVARGEMAAFEVKERFYEIGKPEGLAELDAELSRGVREYGSRGVADPSPAYPQTPIPSSCRAVFVDRDGTLNEMVYDETHGTMDSPRRPDQVVAKSHAGWFLRRMRELGYRIIVVTNQPGLAKGTLTEQSLKDVNDRLAVLLAADDGIWDDLRYCPHHPKPGLGAVAAYVKDCECRKPKPGLLFDGARGHSVDMAGSWMIGDGLVDVQAGRRAGCRTILLSKPKLHDIEQFLSLEDARPDAIAGDLQKAAAIIERGL